jgi:hypothetical protein
VLELRRLAQAFASCSAQAVFLLLALAQSFSRRYPSSTLDVAEMAGNKNKQPQNK